MGGSWSEMNVVKSSLGLSLMLTLAGLPLAAAGPVRDAVDQECAPARDPLWTLFRPYMRDVCANLTGDVGTGPVRPCKVGRVPTDGNTYGTVKQIVHEEIRDQAPCSPHVRDLLNQTSVA